MRTNDYNDLLKKIRCSDDFRKSMQEKLSSAPVETTEYANSVSGTEVITAKHRWGKFAAMAAAFVIVCGAVGGGAYHLARINNKTEESPNISETAENDSIYSKLTANKENYSVDLDDDIKKKDIDKDILFEYLDKYDMTSEIGPSSYTSSDKKITVFFRKIGEEKKNYSYVGATERYDYKLVIYDTGTFTWTENDNGKEKLTMHRFDDGGKIYQDIIDIFADR